MARFCSGREPNMRRYLFFVAITTSAAFAFVFVAVFVAVAIAIATAVTAAFATALDDVVIRIRRDLV